MRFTKDELKSIMGLVVLMWCTLLVILIITVLDIMDGRFPLLFAFVAGVWLMLRIRNRSAIRKRARQEAREEAKSGADFRAAAGASVRAAKKKPSAS